MRESQMVSILGMQQSHLFFVKKLYKRQNKRQHLWKKGSEEADTDLESGN